MSWAQRVAKAPPKECPVTVIRSTYDESEGNISLSHQQKVNVISKAVTHLVVHQQPTQGLMDLLQGNHRKVTSKFPSNLPFLQLNLRGQQEVLPNAIWYRGIDQIRYTQHTITALLLKKSKLPVEGTSLEPRR